MLDRRSLSHLEAHVWGVDGHRDGSNGGCSVKQVSLRLGLDVLAGLHCCTHISSIEATLLILQRWVYKWCWWTVKHQVYHIHCVTELSHEQEIYWKWTPRALMPWCMWYKLANCYSNACYCTLPPLRLKLMWYLRKQGTVGTVWHKHRLLCKAYQAVAYFELVSAWTLWANCFVHCTCTCTGNYKSYPCTNIPLYPYGGKHYMFIHCTHMGLVGVGCLSVDTVVLNDVLEGLVHETATTTLVALSICHN